MRMVRSNVLLAGLFAACACGGLAVRAAWATPPAGVASAPLAGPVAVDEIHIVKESPTHGLILKTRGDWETRAVQFTVAPGGTFGWHSHPGPAFAMVTAGALTKVDADGASAVYAAGTGFVEGVGSIHKAGNEGTVDAKVVVFFLIPRGSNPRIDEPAP